MLIDGTRGLIENKQNEYNTVETIFTPLDSLNCTLFLKNNLTTLILVFNTYLALKAESFA